MHDRASTIDNSAIFPSTHGAQRPRLLVLDDDAAVRERHAHVLREAGRRHRVRCQIAMAKFVAQLERLSTEELDPRGLSMSVQFLPWGTTRFIIKTMATGEVWEIIEIGPDGVSSESSARHHSHL
jgi:hypothetical protein